MSIQRCFFAIGIGWRKDRRFKRFLANIDMTRWMSVEEIEADDYHLFIVGSDQVWNSDIAQNLGLFLLEFCDDPRKKIAYAASFGKSELAPSEREMFRKGLKGFGAIAVREDEAAKIVKELIDVKPEVVCDPTLLLPESAYAKYEAPRRVAHDYILVYSIGAATDYMVEMGNLLGEETGLKVIVVNATRYDWRYIGKEHQIIGPSDFLSFIKHASYVICTSYHATIFSILYQRPFLTVLPKGSVVTSRPRSLLSKLLLVKHLVDEGNLLDGKELVSKIKIDDLKRLEDKVEELQQESLAWLLALL